MAFEMTRLPHSFQLHPAHILTAGSFWVSRSTGAVALVPKTKQRGNHPKQRVQLGNRFLQACSTVATNPHSFQENPVHTSYYRYSKTFTSVLALGYMISICLHGKHLSQSSNPRGYHFVDCLPRGKASVPGPSPLRRTFLNDE